MDWIGCPKKDAACIFVLPNKPILETANGGVHQLIELNGNHWRKIVTIMAKLMTPNLSEWREFRDHHLLNRVAVTFSVTEIDGYQGLVFLVGKTWLDEIPIQKNALRIGDKQHAYMASNYIWSPYLDYRQFPNALIESLRKHISESLC